MRRVSDAFAALGAAARPSPAVGRQAVRTVRELGATCVPLLVRKLHGGSDGEASWAHQLLVDLAHHAGEPVRGRIAAGAERVALDGALGDGRKALALALLAELGAPLPSGVRLEDPGALRERSVRDLVASLLEPADVARAADLLLEQVGADALPEFVEDLLDAAGGGVGPVIDELLLRDDVPGDVMADLRELRRELDEDIARPPAVAARRTVLAGRGAGDAAREIVVVAQRARAKKGAPRPARPRLRAVIVRMTAAGALDSLDYHDSLDDAELSRRCQAEGVPLAPAALAEVAPRVTAAGRRARASGARLPRTYYLGRDLLGLHDEHMTVAAADRVRRLRVRRTPSRPAAAPAPAAPDLRPRAAEHMTRGDFVAARRALARHIDAYPEDAEARSLLGTCLLELAHAASGAAKLELAAETLRQFATAARLEPEDALRHWNLASAAKRLSKAGGCYLALLTYRRLTDVAQGAAKRQRTARSFIHTFERFAREEHPDVDAEAVARGEELFDRAYDHLRAGRYQDAASGFEAVLKLVPSHYPSWGNLGAVHACLERREDAETCWRRALELKPDYEMARKNLASLRA